MNCLKYTLLIFLVIAFSKVASAEFSNIENAQNPIKLTIIGHTGQDPIYKSVFDKPVFINPIKKSPFVDMVTEPELTYSVAELLTDSIGWSNGLLEINDMEIAAYQSPLDTIGEQLNGLPSTGNSQLNSGTIPTPPAFLMLLAGLTASKRRKS